MFKCSCRESNSASEVSAIVRQILHGRTIEIQPAGRTVHERRWHRRECAGLPCSSPPTWSRDQRHTKPYGSCTRNFPGAARRVGTAPSACCVRISASRDFNNTCGEPRRLSCTPDAVSGTRAASESNAGTYLAPDGNSVRNCELFACEKHTVPGEGGRIIRGRFDWADNVVSV